MLKLEAHTNYKTSESRKHSVILRSRMQKGFDGNRIEDKEYTYT
jgi:hypothetical protein